MVTRQHAGLVVWRDEGQLMKHWWALLISMFSDSSADDITYNWPAPVTSESNQDAQSHKH